METIEHKLDLKNDTDETAELISKMKDDFSRFISGEIKELVLKNTTDYSERNLLFIKALAPILKVSIAKEEMDKAEKQYAIIANKLNEFIETFPDGEAPVIESAQDMYNEVFGIRDQLMHLWELMPKLGNFKPCDFGFHAKAMSMLTTYMDLLSKFADLQDYLLRMKELTWPPGMAGLELDEKFIEETFKPKQPTRH